MPPRPIGARVAQPIVPRPTTRTRWRRVSPLSVTDPLPLARSARTRALGQPGFALLSVAMNSAKSGANHSAALQAELVPRRFGRNTEMGHDFDFAPIFEEACRNPEIRRVSQRIWNRGPATQAEVGAKPAVLRPGGDELSPAQPTKLLGRDDCGGIRQRSGLPAAGRAMTLIEFEATAVDFKLNLAAKTVAAHAGCSRQRLALVVPLPCCSTSPAYFISHSCAGSL